MSTESIENGECIGGGGARHIAQEHTTMPKTRAESIDSIAEEIEKLEKRRKPLITILDNAVVRVYP